MFFVLLFIVLILAGAVMLFAGIVLAIIWVVRAGKGSKTSAVLKVFAVLLAVLGLILVIGPPLAIRSISRTAQKNYDKEVSDLAEDDVVHVDALEDIFDDGFEFGGRRFVMFTGITPQDTHKNYSEVLVGAVVDKNGSHWMIYSVDNTAGVTIFNVDGTEYFTEEGKEDYVVDYYLNKAPLYCEVSLHDSDDTDRIGSVDADHIRKIINAVDEDGTHLKPDEITDRKDYDILYFYSTDDMICMWLYCWQTDDGIIVSDGGEYLYLGDEDASYISKMVR